MKAVNFGSSVPLNIDRGGLLNSRQSRWIEEGRKKVYVTESVSEVPLKWCIIS